MTDIRHVLVAFGGRSSEHGVSCLSARNVMAAIGELDGWQATCVGITRDGRWTLVDEVPADPGDGTLPEVGDEGPTVVVVRTRTGPRLVRLDGAGEEVAPVDVAFPVLHGPYGEDGTVQGLLASAGVPYVGADVGASAIGIDKRQMKHVFSARGLPQIRHLAVRRTAWDADADRALDDIEAALRYPVYTKPARQGSSIGIRRCATREQLVTGIAEAFDHDRVAIIEEGLEHPRELECGVMGNADVVVTPPGELVHTGEEFYDFAAKYLRPVEISCPADVPEAVTQRCRDFAREAFLAIGGRGMARVDFFYVEATGELWVNEINTIPGMTDQSMFWYLWEAEGRTRADVVADLLELAVETGEQSARFSP